MTSLAWADDQTLISTGAGDAVIIWRYTSAPLPLTPLPTDPQLVSPQAQPVSALPQNIQSMHAELRLHNQFPGSSSLALNEAVAVSTTAIGPMTGSPSNQGSSLALTWPTPGQPVAACSALMPQGLTSPAASKVLTMPHTAEQQLAGLALMHSAEHAAATSVIVAAEHNVVASTAMCGDGHIAAGAVRTSLLPYGDCEPENSSHAVPTPWQLQVERVIGYNGKAQNGCIWLESSGQLVYATGCTLILEDLETRHQR